MQRTLKREFKELEVVEREAIAVSEGCQHVGSHFLSKFILQGELPNIAVQAGISYPGMKIAG